MRLLSFANLVVSALRPILLLIPAGIVLLSGCDKVALLAPTNSTITLTVSTTVVPLNGSADVVASVVERAGTAVHDGTVVTFTATFGRIEPTEARTQGGRARARFVGTSSGKATITASSGSATAEVKDILVGGAAAGSVALRANPATLPQTGGSTEIFAVVRDASGNLLPGAPVSFTTDQGILSATAAVTNEAGEATVRLTTNRDATVTATVISGVTATTKVVIINAPTVTITTSTANPAVGVGVNFTLTPGASTSGVPIQNASVNFGDGSPVVNLGPISGATNLTHIYGAAGTYTVTASVVDAAGQGTTATISVTVQRIAPTVTLTPASSTITVGQALAFTVTATPGTGGPPIQSVRVTMNPGGETLFTGSGSGSFTRVFGSTGTYTLTATATDTAGSTGSASAVVTVGGFDVTLDAAGGSLVCSGTPKTCTGLTAGTNVTFTATVTTAGVVPVSYTWNWGDASPEETTTARINSHRYNTVSTWVATVTVTSSTGATATQIVVLKP